MAKFWVPNTTCLNITRLKLLDKLYIESSDIQSVDGYWDAICNKLKDNKRTPEGTRLIYLNSVAGRSPITSHWLALIPVRTYHTTYADILEIMTSSFWAQSQRYCKGFLVFTESAREIIKANGIKHPVVLMPIVHTRTDDYFHLNKHPNQIFYVGGNLEKVKLFQQRHVNFSITALVAHEEDTTVVDSLPFKVFKHINKKDYLSLLKTAIVIIDEYEDQRSFSLVNDCIRYGNPVILSNTSRLKKYIGFQYPLFYLGPDDITLFLNDPAYLRMGIHYIMGKQKKTTIDFGKFAKSLELSAPYRVLPGSDDQGKKFQDYDISVVINLSEETPEEVKETIMTIACQRFDRRFELIIWNSSPSLSAIVYELYALFKDQANMKVIESLEKHSHRYLEGLSSLVRSPLILYIRSMMSMPPDCLQSMYSQNQPSNGSFYYYKEGITPIDEETPPSVPPRSSQSEDYEKVKEASMFLFQRNHLKATLLLTNTTIDQLREIGYGFIYLFIEQMNLSVQRLILEESHYEKENQVK